MNWQLGTYDVLGHLTEDDKGPNRVYRVSDSNGRVCVVKVSNVPVSQDPDFAEDMKSLAESANFLSHRNIAQVQDFFLNDNRVELNLLSNA